MSEVSQNPAKSVEELAQELFLSYRLAERERLRERQAEGIARARDSGVRFGRPQLKEPANFGRIVSEWESKRITVETAARLCGMSESTFFRRLREYRRRVGK